MLFCIGVKDAFHRWNCEKCCSNISTRGLRLSRRLLWFFRYSRERQRVFVVRSFSFTRENFLPSRFSSCIEVSVSYFLHVTYAVGFLRAFISLCVYYVCAYILTGLFVSIWCGGYFQKVHSYPTSNEWARLYIRKCVRCLHYTRWKFGTLPKN